MIPFNNVTTSQSTTKNKEFQIFHHVLISTRTAFFVEILLIFQPHTKLKILWRIPVKRKVEDDDSERYKAFLVPATHITSHDEDYVSFKQLNEIMAKEGVQPYCSKWMKFRLLHHFKEQEVIITRVSHMNDHIVILHEKSTRIIHNFYSTTIKQSENDKKMEIIKEAARLIKSEILSISPNKEEFNLLMI
ncbi:uncharacterized protein LOC123475824 [Daphnia magna]|uniref:uncharacterized protein LOC123475824 n=1 Tax=Daphnia magna TaxID=35525 RepID=UPI001E1BDE11|nr:uncharacterized protein LOC123475824 [Daphnia magna]